MNPILNPRAAGPEVSLIGIPGNFEYLKFYFPNNLLISLNASSVAEKYPFLFRIKSRW